MITRTKEEVLDFAKTLWPEVDKIEWYNDTLSVSQMYDAPDLTLTHLMKLATFFDTMNVGKYDDIAMGGCETCDFRSSYGFELKVAPGDSPPAQY